MSTYFTGYIVLQGFCKGRNVAVNVSAQNNGRYKNEKTVLCLSFVVEIKREPERNHLSCVTLKTDHREVSSFKMELHGNIEEFQWTPAYAGADLRGSRHVSLRRVPWTPLPCSRRHFITCLYTRTILRYMAATVGRTNNYGKYVSIDIVLSNTTGP